MKNIVISESENEEQHKNNNRNNAGIVKKITTVDPKEKRWQLLAKINDELNELLNKNIVSKKILYLKKNLDKIMELKEKLKAQEQNLKIAKIISLKERNAYLEKLRQIEDYGEKLDWKDDSGILGKINDLLYND